MKFRCIYSLTVYDTDADFKIIVQRFFSNKRSADRVYRRYSEKYGSSAILYRKLGSFEHRYINPDDVER